MHRNIDGALLGLIPAGVALMSLPYVGFYMHVSKSTIMTAKLMLCQHASGLNLH